MLAVARGMSEGNAGKRVVKVSVGDWLGASTFLGYAFLLSAVEKPYCEESNEEEAGDAGDYAPYYSGLLVARGR